METDIYLEYAKAHKDTFIRSVIGDIKPSNEKDQDAIFMAGSPGAGKSEVAQGLVDNFSNHVVIDADYFRTQFPDYNGMNSSLFQKASSWLVEQTFKFVIDNGYSFILDATFAILSAEKNIKRALNNHYTVTIVYVYQDPEIAWCFTKQREKVEGRVVPKETFINAFFKSRENIEKIKSRYPEVTLHMIVKNYQNSISEVHYDTDNISLLLTNNLTPEGLENILND